jgi:hypothetical protein
MTSNNFFQGALSMCTWGLFIGVVTYGHCNICNAPRLHTLAYHCAITRSLHSFVIYKYFCTPQMRMRHVSTVPRRWRRGPLAHRWPSAWSFIILRSPMRKWPSAQSPIVPRELRAIRFSLGSDWAEAPPCDRLLPARNVKVHRRWCQRAKVG